MESVKDKDLLRANIAKVIRDIRKSNDLTQKEFAEKLEVNSNYISMIERGERTPSLDLLADISDTFNIKLHQIFLQAEMPELGGDFKRIYHLTKLLDDVNFDKLHDLAEKIANGWDLESSGSKNGSEKGKVTH